MEAPQAGRGFWFPNHGIEVTIFLNFFLWVLLIVYYMLAQDILLLYDVANVVLFYRL